LLHFISNNTSKASGKCIEGAQRSAKAGMVGVIFEHTDLLKLDTSEALKMLLDGGSSESGDNTVKRALMAKLSWPLPCYLDDTALKSLLYTLVEHTLRDSVPAPLCMAHSHGRQLLRDLKRVLPVPHSRTSLLGIFNYVMKLLM
jgi:hypothetical protein